TLPSPSLTVNGIIHTTGTANDSNLTYTPGFEGDFRNGETGYGVDANKVQELFSGIAGSDGMTLAIGGLDPGKEYLFQAYWDNNLSSNTLNMNIEGDTLSGVSSLGDKNTPALYGGTLISYQFFAGDNTLNAVFDLDQVGAGNNWLSGYSLQEVVPEPSTTALLGLGGLALILRRRK
ncbi:MAG: PEP-CTERM sorting domain-containing protein, partial [Akkermansiaceae bacterium]